MRRPISWYLLHGNKPQSKTAAARKLRDADEAAAMCARSVAFDVQPSMVDLLAEQRRAELNKLLAEDGFDVEITPDGSLLPVGYRRPPGPKQSSAAESAASCSPCVCEPVRAVGFALPPQPAEGQFPSSPQMSTSGAGGLS